MLGEVRGKAIYPSVFLALWNFLSKNAKLGAENTLLRVI